MGKVRYSKAQKVTRNILRSATLALITTISIGCIKDFNETAPVFNYTQEDITNNFETQGELTELSLQEEILFENKEIYSLLLEQCGGELTQSKLKKITHFKIPYKLLNNDLSDLKYLPNLASLEINENEVDLSHLKYNQKLLKLVLNNCTVSNTQELPNTIYSFESSYTTVTNNQFTIPYNVSNLDLTYTKSNNLRLRNPQGLKELYINGDTYLDLNALLECTKLSKITLKRISNISNSEVLCTLGSLEKLTVDDFAPIWMSYDVYGTLSSIIDAPSTIHNEFLILDDIAEQINEKSTDDEEKIKNITLYILETLSYDEELSENELSEQRVTEYNNYPLYTAFNNLSSVCINYGCLFQALANRCGVESYQLYNDFHTWNYCNVNGEFTNIDTTYIDGKPLVETDINGYRELALQEDLTVTDYFNTNTESNLYYYEFNLDEYILDTSHDVSLLPEKIIEPTENIGYIDDNLVIRFRFQNKDYLLEYRKYLLAIALIEITRLIISLPKKKKEKQITLEKINRGE